MTNHGSQLLLVGLTGLVTLVAASHGVRLLVNRTRSREKNDVERARRGNSRSAGETDKKFGRGEGPNAAVRLCLVVNFLGGANWREPQNVNAVRNLTEEAASDLTAVNNSNG